MTKKITMNQMNHQANKIADNYTRLQQELFYLLIDATKDTRSLLMDREHPLAWRFAMLQKMGGITEEVVRMVAKTANMSEQQIKSLIEDNGLKVAQQMNSQLATMLQRKNKPISSTQRQIIKSYAHQAFLDIDNNVNQTLLTTNYGENAAMRTFQDIVNRTTLDIQTGRKTPQRALTDNIMQWQDKGMKTSLIDKGGHQWSLEGYTRTVLTSTASRTFNDTRIQSMKEFDSVLATMTSHPAAREACSHIQGKVVNIVPPTHESYNPRYDSIYNYGYGQPSETLGINCRHDLYPYVEGVSHNFQKHYDPRKARKNADIQQKQRYYERSVRHQKEKLKMANKLGDEKAQRKLKTSIRGYQSKLRDIVKDNDFLARQYGRERIVAK
ncbi:phage minor capsid protein [Ligilactobacillus acidipiscis]|nr:phage minor capsid protein [Ligilactobacillus acidipiscis]GAW63076.1 putative minor capsid protein [Ligilactobacillus acidipiscis]GEN19671.1 hypothetical protein LAC02_29520 [Ligilactobacillus acidipiscis]